MNNFTTNTYEMQKEILNFSKKMSINLDKPSSKFISDMIFGIEKSQSILFLDIVRELSEKNKLKHAHTWIKEWQNIEERKKLNN